MLRHRINPGLELRQLQPADAVALFALVDAHRSSLREWLPWVDATVKLADTEKYIGGTLRDLAATRAFTCGIWSDGRLVGVIGHNRIDWAHRIAFPHPITGLPLDIRCDWPGDLRRTLRNMGLHRPVATAPMSEVEVAVDATDAGSIEGS